MFSAIQHQILPGVICYLPFQHEIDSTLYIDDDLMGGAFNHPVIVLSLGADDDGDQNNMCDISIVSSSPLESFTSSSLSNLVKAPP
jgi:hypothetical protein